jgi:hypothetical protein
MYNVHSGITYYQNKEDAERRVFEAKTTSNDDVTFTVHQWTKGYVVAVRDNDGIIVAVL